MLALNLSKVMEFSCPACWYAVGSSVALLMWVQLWLTCAAKTWSSSQFYCFLLLIWRRFFFSLCCGWNLPVSIRFTFYSNKMEVVVKVVNFLPQKAARWNKPRIKFKHLLRNHRGLYLECCFQYMDIWSRL